MKTLRVMAIAWLALSVPRASAAVSAPGRQCEHELDHRSQLVQQHRAGRRGRAVLSRNRSQRMNRDFTARGLSIGPHRLVLRGNINLNGHAPNVDAAEITALAGSVSGSGGLSKNGDGTLIVSGNMVFTGRFVANTIEMPAHGMRGILHVSCGPGVFAMMYGPGSQLWKDSSQIRTRKGTEP